jgi:hypothetical protein
MKILLSILSVSFVIACGKTEPSTSDKTAPSTSPAPSSVAPADKAPAAPPTTAKEPPADNRCEVVVEGDIKDRGVGPAASSSVGTDYWLSDSEIRTALEVMASLSKNKKRDIDADMKKDPRIMTLILNCQTPRTKVSFLPAPSSKYADVPFAPKKYKIAKGKSAGVMRTMVTFEKDTGVWNVDGEGELDITKFDQTGIAGSFAFDVIEQTFGSSATPARKAKVTGTFAFKCTPGTANCKG